MWHFYTFSNFIWAIPKFIRKKFYFCRHFFLLFFLFMNRAEKRVLIFMQFPKLFSFSTFSTNVEMDMHFFPQPPTFSSSQKPIKTHTSISKYTNLQTQRSSHVFLTNSISHIVYVDRIDFDKWPNNNHLYSFTISSYFKSTHYNWNI